MYENVFMSKNKMHGSNKKVLLYWKMWSISWRIRT